ncbi:MAG: isoprenylcysteine carboxylmethyltransferase family protein [Phycisphaerae bacterium]
MVDPTPNPTSPADKPFALRACFFTAAFLAFILGVVPSLFRLGDRLFQPSGSLRSDISQFWSGFQHLTGVAVFAGGLWVYLACSAWLIFFGKGPHVEFDPPRVFVASGPYRWCRNPVAASLIVTVLGEAIYFSSLGILLLVLIGLPIAHWQVTRIEEPRLRQRFGESYEAYCRRVPRWVPRPPTD